MNRPPPNPKLLKTPPYIEGLRAEELRRLYGVENIIEMASNENALGPPPKAVGILLNSLGQINRYPGVLNQNLRRRLSIVLGPGIDESQIIIGNGGLELLQLVCDVYLSEGLETICSKITWPAYMLRTIAAGGIPVKVPAKDNFNQDLDAIADSITEKTRIIFLCSPNNPTGELIDRLELENLLFKIPDHVVLVLDEAYIDFVDEDRYYDTTKYVIEKTNIILLRSFSKGRGLAGIRIAYLIAREEIIKDLSHAVLGMHVGSLGLIAAEASLEDREFFNRSRSLVLDEKKYLSGELIRLGLSCLETQGNFLLITNLPASTTWICDQLLRQGVIVRPMEQFGLREAIRITICKHEQNQRFISALEEILNRFHNS